MFFFPVVKACGKIEQLTHSFKLRSWYSRMLCWICKLCVCLRTPLSKCRCPVCVCVCSWCEWTWAISFLPQCLLTKPSRTLSHSAQSALSVSFISFSLSLLLLPLLSHPHPAPPPPNVCLHPGSPRAPGAAWRDWPRWSQGLCVECF